MTDRPTPERPILFSGPMVRAILEGRKTQTRRVVRKQPTTAIRSGTVGHWSVAPDVRRFLCPYGIPGDRLWVRETHWINNAEKIVAYRSDGEMPIHMKGEHWKPSIHMPRWASRITLEVTRIRVERVQEIVAGDCVAEGICTRASDGADLWRNDLRHGWTHNPAGLYHALWDSLNAARAPWSSNPWVWVIEFRLAELRRLLEG